MKQSNIKGIAVILAILLLAVGFAYAEGSAPTFRDVGFKVYARYFDFNNTQATNLTNVTFNNTPNNATPAIHYIDLLNNDTTGDLIFRSRDTSGALTERLRIKAQTNVGGAVVFTELNLPTARPATPLNGTFTSNLTNNNVETYTNGAWHTQVTTDGTVPFTSLILPTSRPSTPVNGSYVLNLTDNSTEVYANGAWHYSGNGTVKN